MPFPSPRSAARRTRPGLALGAVVATAALTVSTLATAAPSGAAPGDGPEEVRSVPVGSTLDGVRIDGSVERGRESARGPVVLPESAAPATAYQMPFRCGEAWVGTTRSSHSPSVLSVDWNRTDDFDMPVVASAGGTVTTATSSSSGYGKWVVVDHGNNESTLYAHLNSIGVKVGDKVTQGKQLGRLGTTGNSTGPHLHYEQRQGRSVVHPYFDGKKFSFNSTLTSRNCASSAPVLSPKPLAGDVPLAADVVDDAADETVRWRRLDSARYEARRADGSKKVITMGNAGDQPVLGDWDGRGKASPGVFKPGAQRFVLRSPAGRRTISFGYKGSIPLAGDWDGDGKDEIGVWRPAITRFDLRGPDGGVLRKITVGEKDHLPFVGDWNGDGKHDVGTYDRETRTFHLRYPTGRIESVVFGPNGGLPIAGDWDNDGTDEIGAWNPRTKVFSRRR